MTRGLDEVMTTATKISLSTIGYIMLSVKDMARSKAFYRDTLGLPIGYNDDSWAEFECKGTKLALHILDASKVDAKAGGSPFIIFSVDDIRATHALLQAANVGASELHQVSEGPDGVGVSTDFKDPDGHQLSVFGTIPRDQWKA